MLLLLCTVDMRLLRNNQNTLSESDSIDVHIPPATGSIAVRAVVGSLR
jgi:hypothetical protein